MFAKLFASITESSLWSEPKEVRLLFVSMLARADQTGFVEAAIPGLARLANLTIEETETALECLKSPDKYSKNPDFEGRRIAEIAGGYLILNYETYRSKRDEEKRREYMRDYMADYRKNGKQPVNTVNSSKPSVSHSKPPLAQAEAEAEAEETQSEALSKSVSKGKKRRCTSVQDSPEFLEFWKAYPRRTSKGLARRAWLKAIKKIDAETILVAVDRYAKQQRGKDQQFVKHPSTWLNGECWSDESLKPKDPFWYLSLPPDEREAFIRSEIAKP